MRSSRSRRGSGVLTGPVLVPGVAADGLQQEAVVGHGELAAGGTRPRQDEATGTTPAGHLSFPSPQTSPGRGINLGGGVPSSQPAQVRPRGPHGAQLWGGGCRRRRFLHPVAPCPTCPRCPTPATSFPAPGPTPPQPRSPWQEPPRAGRGRRKRGRPDNALITQEGGAGTAPGHFLTTSAPRHGQQPSGHPGQTGTPVPAPSPPRGPQGAQHPLPQTAPPRSFPASHLGRAKARRRRRLRPIQ